jgi:hypothetical protein
MNLKLKIYLFVYIIFMVTIPVQGLTTAHDNEALILEDIRMIDIKADKVNTLRKSLRKGMDEAVIFSKEANRWFEKAGRVEIQIRKIQAAPGNTYQGQNKQVLLNKLNTQKSQIHHLNGGVTIGGTYFTSIQQLDEANQKQSRNAVDMGKRYREVVQELDAIDRERDTKTRQLKKEAGLDIKWTKKELKNIEGVRNHTGQLLNDPEIWFIPSFFKNDIQNNRLEYSKNLGLRFKGPPPYISRQAAINYITQQYLKEIAAEGIDFDQKVLVEVIKYARDQSNEMKSFINTDLMTEMDKKIAEYRNRIKLFEDTLDPSGCWLLVLPGSKDLPQVLVIDQGNGRYEGYIQHVGTLKHFHKNQFLFRAQRQSRNTIGGHERTFNNAGEIVTVPIRITIHEDRTIMTYRSDETVTMRQCN